MAIAHVQSTGDVGDNATSVSKAYASNVTNGNLLVIVCGKWADVAGGDTFAVGDISKSAGTATVGSFTLDKQLQLNVSSNYYINVGIFSVPVTGTGSCTITVGSMASGSYSFIGIAEFSGVDVTSGRVDGTNSANGANGGGDSGNVTSTAGALFIGGKDRDETGAQAITPDAAFTQIYESEDGANHNTGSAIYRIVTGATTDSASWSAPTAPSGRSWVAALVVYKESGGAPAATVKTLAALGVG